MKIRSSIVFLCAGVGIGWFTSVLVGGRGEHDSAVSDPGVPPDFVARETADRDVSASESGAQSDVTAETGSIAEATFTASENLSSASPEVAAPVLGGSRIVEPPRQSDETFYAPASPTSSTSSTPSRDSRVSQLSDLPPSASLSAVELEDTLLSDTQIVCEFPSWKGGPLVIDLINYFSPGSARMSGALSAPEREFVVRMEPTAAGLHFSGVTSNGNFLAVTIFGVLDESGRYVAVHSRHQGSITVNSRTSGYYGEQWYGGCS